MVAFTPTYPLTIPTTPGFSHSNIRLAKSIGITTSIFTFHSQVQQFDGEVWTGEFKLPPMIRSQAGQWQAFFMQLRGRRGTFRLGDPDNTSLLGAATGTIRVNGASQVGNQVALDGFANSTTDVFKKGDYIQINSYMYLVTDDASSNGSGEADVKIEPALRQSIETISDNTIITYGSSAKTVWRMDDNTLGWDGDRVSRYGFNFSCTEAL